jgi:hypothetical protein
MGLSVVTVAAGGLPVVEMATGGLPVTEAANRFGIAVTKVVGKPGLGVTFAGGAAGPPTANYVGQFVNAANLAVYTFSGVDIGTPAADRRVHIGNSINSQAVLPDSITVNGVAAVLNVSAQASAGVAQIWTALVPTGTTASIVVTYASARGNGGITVWTSTGLSSNTAFGTGTAVNSLGNADINLDVPTKAGGFILAYGVHGNAVVSALTWQPAALVHRHFTLIEAGTQWHSPASGPTDGSTFDIRTSAVSVGGSVSAMIAGASFG